MFGSVRWSVGSRRVVDRGGRDRQVANRLFRLVDRVFDTRRAAVPRGSQRRAMMPESPPDVKHGIARAKPTGRTRGLLFTYPSRGGVRTPPRAACLAIATESTAMSAGVTPGTRAAWPRLRGRMRESFSRDSNRRAPSPW